MQAFILKPVLEREKRKWGRGGLYTATFILTPVTETVEVELIPSLYTGFTGLLLLLDPPFHPPSPPAGGGGRQSSLLPRLISIFN